MERILRQEQEIRKMNRFKLITVAVILLASSCHKGSQDLPEILRVEITDEISLNWNNTKQRYVKDSLFERAVINFESEKDLIINRILSTKRMNAQICGLEGNMTLGDLAFVFLDEVERISYSNVFSWQFDFMSDTCAYSTGVLWYLSTHRTEAKRQIENSFK